MATMRSSTKISGGGAVPKLGGGTTGLQSAMFALANLGQKQGIMNEADIAKEDELAGSVANTAKNVSAQFGGNVPRGSKITRGGVTVELNPRPNQAEAADIASQSVMEPIFKDITRMLREGYMDGPSKNPIERTMRQGIVDLGQPIFASQDERLKQLTSAFNKLKMSLPFDQGGKQLTGTEKELVFKVLNVTGKDDATILSDLNFAMDKIRQRALLASGGLNASDVSKATPFQATIPTQSQAGSQTGRITVIDLKTGKRGTISANKFDSKKFSKV